MIVTERFVYIHMPKTGGTFVSEVLRRLHHRDGKPPRPRTIIERVLRGASRRMGIRQLSARKAYGPIQDLEPKHGTCHDIPEQYRDLPILATVRNPYDWYVSQYEFGWWKRTFMYQPELYPTPVGEAIERVLPSFIEENPTFPDITFDCFMILCEDAAKAANPYSADLGLYSYGFLKFFHPEPDMALRRIAGNDRDVRGVLQEILQVKFIMTHRLNQQLQRFLLASGYEPRDLVFISALEKILPMGRGRREDQPWQQYYTSHHKGLVRHRDRLLFEEFPEFDRA